MGMKKTMEMYQHVPLPILPLITGSDSAFVADEKPNQEPIDNVQEEEHGNVPALPAHKLSPDHWVRLGICGK